MSDINTTINTIPLEIGSIIDSTLTKGHENRLCNFSLQQKKDFIILLDKFGIEYVELQNPNLSNNLLFEFESLIEFKKTHNLSIKFIINVRNDRNDIQKIININSIDNNYIDNNYIHLKINLDNIESIDLKETIKNLSLIKPNINIHLSIKNAFQIHPNIISHIISETETYINTICLEDSSGTATHYDVEGLLTIIDIYNTSIECTFQNDSSSAVYNSYIALLNGCKYINTSVLGIGQKNGITDLSGLISRIYTISKPSLDKYNLHLLKQIDDFVSKILNIYIPINNPITGFSVYHNNSSKQNHPIHNVLNCIDFNLENDINIIEFDNLKHFLYENNVKIDDEYIKKLSYTLQDNINKNPKLYYTIYVNKKFALKYILKYIR
jgi:homocitrate synthase